MLFLNGGEVLLLNIDSNVFDLLAMLCSFFSKEDERKCAIRWLTANEEQIRKLNNRYKKMQDIVLKAVACEYKFSEADIAYLNDELKWIEENIKDIQDDIYLLIIRMENTLEAYSSWQNNNPIYHLAPLNLNVEKCGIAIYPRLSPRWNTKKSERNRVRIFNAKFKNYMMIRTEEVQPFEIVMHYWNDQGVLKVYENGWKMPMALSPVMDYADLNTVPYESAEGKTVSVEGLKNDEEVTNRVLQIFDILFSREYSIIVFPEALGTSEVVKEIKKKMRMHPEYCTFVLLPTICEKGSNSLIVLGPDGIEVLRHEKAVPFILIGKDGAEERESLEYKKEIHLLMTKELGLVAFVICAELLDPDFYHILTNVAMVDTIICPSFSPGINAFKETMLKGVPAKILQVYVNTCSAKAVSRNGQVSDTLVLVQVPNMDKKVPIEFFERECGGECAKTACYFDIAIIYQENRFVVEGMHCTCA